jgi:broad specificity phosphatase PhoE
MKIYILRHEDSTMDSTMFSPLTKDGLDHSIKIIKILKEEDIDKIYSSPFIRALQTIYPYAKKSNQIINIDYSLSEIQHPIVIPERSYQITLPQYIAESFNVNMEYTSTMPPTEYSYPEDDKKVEQRVKKFISKIVTDMLDTKYNILIVTHQLICNIIIKLATKNNKNINIDSTYNYMKGGLTRVFYKDRWVFEPINWEYKMD